MARLGLGRKREEEEQERAAIAADPVAEGRDYAKNVAAAKQATKTAVVAEHPTNPFEQTKKKSDAQIVADYDAEMAVRDGMAPGNAKHDLGYNDITIDFSTIKDNDQAAYIASTMYGEKARQAVLKDWASYSGQDEDAVLFGAEELLGTRLFASPMSKAGQAKAVRNEAMGVLSSGLMMDADGNDVDMKTASLPMIVQSIRTDPDSTSRKNKVKALKTLTETEGSRFYGQTFDEDVANTFLGGADWDADGYKETQNYASAFYAGTGHEEDNIQAYLEKVSEIQDGNFGDAYSTRQQRSMRAALDKAYEQTTGYKAPTDEEIAAYSQATSTGTEDSKKGSGFLSGIRTFFFGDEKKLEGKKSGQKAGEESAAPEKTSQTEGQNVPQDVPEADKQEAGAAMQSRFGGEANGGNVDLTNRPQVSYETMAAAGHNAQAVFYGMEEQAATIGETPVFPSEKAEEKGADFRWFDDARDEANAKKEQEEFAQNAAITNERESVSTIAEAFALWRKGEALTQEEHNAVESVLSSNGGKMIFNRGKAAASANADMLSNSMAANAKELSFPGLHQSYGSKIQEALNILDSGVLDEQTTENGYLALAQIINNADAWIENGQISISSGKNPYNVYINANMNDPERASAVQVIENIKAAGKLVNESQKKQAEEAKQAQEEDNQARIDRLESGTPTDEDVQWYYDKKNDLYDADAVQKDRTAMEFGRNLNTILDAENGEYWKSDSAAAAEGLEGQTQSEFREALGDEARKVLQEYAGLALIYGKTAREYLESCGITDPNQIADVAYSRMVKRGNDFLTSETAQTGLAEDNSATIGLLPALGTGAAYGALDTADQFASAPYNMLDAATYEKTRDSIMNQYNGQYGTNGRAVYRAQLMTYAESGNMSNEQKQALLDNIARASDIYDVAYEIDPNFLTSGYRAFLGMLDNTKEDLYDYGMLGNDFERTVFSGAANISGSATGMAISMGTSALGATPLTASAVAYGTGSWNRTYEEAVSNGMSKGAAANLALGSGVISTLINTPGAEAESGMFASGRSLLELQLAKQDALKTATFWGKLKLYAGNMATQGVKQSIGEGIEEVSEDTLNSLWVTSATPVFEKLDKGQSPTVSDVLKGISTLKPVELLKQGAQSFAGGFLASAVFNLAGYAGLAIKRALPGYDAQSVVLAQQMLDGTKDPTPENIADLMSSLAADISQPGAAQAVDKTARQAQDAQNTVAAAMSGTGKEQFEAGNEQMRMALDAQAKADAAQQAAQAAKAEFEQLSDAVAGGDIDRIQDMRAARVRMGENQKTANEYADTASKHREAGKEAYQKALEEARAMGQQLSDSQNQQEMQRVSEAIRQAMEYDNAEQDAAYYNRVLEQQDTLGYDEGTKQAVEEQLLGAQIRMEEIAKGADAQTQAEIEALKQQIETIRAADMGEMGDQLIQDAEETIQIRQNENLFYQKDTVGTPQADQQTEALRGLAGRVSSISEAIENGEQVDQRVVDAMLGELDALSGDVADGGEAIAAARQGGKLQSAVEDASGMDASVRHDVAELGKVEGLQSLTREAEEIAQRLKSGEEVSRKEITALQKKIDAQINSLDQTTSDLFAEDVMVAARQGGGLDTIYQQEQEKTALTKRATDSVNKLTKAQEAAAKAEEMTRAIENGQQVSESKANKVIDDVYRNLSKMDETVADILYEEMDSVADKAGRLAVALDSAKESDKARFDSDWIRYEEARTQKENAKKTYNALNDLASTLRKTKIYVNDQQKAEILHQTGYKSLPQVNFAYGTGFTTDYNQERTISLDRIYPDLTELAPGYLDAGAYHPETEILSALDARKNARAAMQKKIEKPEDRAQIRKAVPGVMDGDVQSADGTASYRGVQAEQAAAKKKNGDNIVKVTKQLASDIGVGSTLGARNMSEAPGALGYYRENMRYMATDARSAGRVDVAMHEIGHALGERLGMDGTPQMVENLIKANPAFAKGYSDAQLSGEAMAEFTWRYLVSDAEAKAFAGDGFVATFERALEDKGLDKAIQKAKNGVRNYLNQSVSEQVGSMIVNASDAKADPKLDERFQKLIYDMVDNTAPAEKANEIIRQATGEKVVDFESNLRESALLRNTADKRAYVQISDALTDVQGTRIGDSLKTRIADAGVKGKDFDEFSRYWLTLHSLDRDAQGKPVFDENALPAAQRKAYIEKMNRAHPEFKQGMEAIQSFRHDFMQTWMVDTGYMKQWQLDMFEAMYPNYAPTNRVKDNAPVRGNGNGNGRSFTLRAATGSTEQVIHPFDTFVDNVQRIVKMNMDNQTNLLFDQMYNSYEGFGVLGRPIEQTAMEFSDAQTAKAQHTVEETLRNSNASEDVIASILDGIDADRAHFEGAAGENNVITVQHEDGSKTYYSITDPLFYKMMTNATDGGGKLLGTLGNLTRTMSVLTTGSNPVFSIRNMLRDFQNSVRYGTWTTNYAEGIVKWVGALMDVVKNSESYQDYVAQGGGGWTRMDVGNAKSAQELRGMVFDNGKWSDNYSTATLGGKGKWAGKKLAELATLAPINEAIEQASRYAEYKYGKHDLNTAKGRTEAFRAAQEVTVDFSRKGASGMARDISALVPFFNASLQGVYRTARQVTKQESGRAGARLAKTVLNTGAALALANGLCLKYLDDEDKEAFYYMSDDLKSKHMFLPNFARAANSSLPPLIRIPLDQDPVAYAVNGLMTNVIWGKQADDWAIDFTASMATVADSLNPIGSTILDPLVATQTNKNWYGSRIVPTYMDNWDVTTQYTDETPEAFVTLGRALGQSPMMLQYIFQQYTGFVGQIAIPAMTGMKDGNIASSTANAYLSYAQSQITSNPLKSNDVIGQMYDNSKVLETVVKASENGKEMNMLRGDLTSRQAQKAYSIAYDLTHKGGKLYECKQTISDGYTRIEKINERDDLTDAEKYELTQKIRMDMCHAALKANEVYAQFDEAYISGETLSSRLLKRAFGGTVASE